MSGVAVVGVVLGTALVLGGLRAAARPTAAFPEDPPGRRFLIALHDAARAAVWFSLGAAFLVLSLVEDPFAFRWLVLVPIGFAAARVLAGFALARE